MQNSIQCTGEYVQLKSNCYSLKSTFMYYLLINYYFLILNSLFLVENLEKIREELKQKQSQASSPDNKFPKFLKAQEKYNRLF